MFILAAYTTCRLYKSNLRITIKTVVSTNIVSHVSYSFDESNLYFNDDETRDISFSDVRLVYIISHSFRLNVMISYNHFLTFTLACIYTTVYLN